MPARTSALIGEHNVPPTSSEHNVPLILPSEGGDDLGDAELVGVLSDGARRRCTLRLAANGANSARPLPSLVRSK